MGSSVLWFTPPMSDLISDAEMNDPSVLYRIVQLAATQRMGASYPWYVLKNATDSQGKRLLAKPMEDFRGRNWTAAGIMAHGWLHVQNKPDWEEFKELLYLAPKLDALTLGYAVAGVMRPPFWSNEADPDITEQNRKEWFENHLNAVIKGLDPEMALAVEAVAAGALMEVFQATFIGTTTGSPERARRVWASEVAQWVEGIVAPTLPDWGHDQARRPLVEMACEMKGLLARHAQAVEVSPIEVSSVFATPRAGSTAAHSDPAWQNALLSQSLKLASEGEPPAGKATAWAWKHYESISLALLALEAQDEPALVDTFRQPVGKSFVESVSKLSAIQTHLNLLDRSQVMEGWERFAHRAQVMKARGLALGFEDNWQSLPTNKTRAPRF